MKFVNLTPHAITIKVGDREITIEPSGKTARVGTNYVPKGEIDGIPVVGREFTDVMVGDAPFDVACPVEDGTAYIVSAMVLDRVGGRADVFAPDTGPTAIRNDKGHIVAVTRLVQ